MARLSIALFGPFQATLMDEPVRFESDKARALLAYLVTEADVQHRREKLAGLLWPGGTESSARNNLRHTLAVLRRAIGDREAQIPALDVTRQTVQFCPESDAWTDVTAFTRLLRASEGSAPEAINLREQAVALYRGDLLQDLALADSPEFEEWAVLSREQLRRQALDALSTLAQALEDCGQVERALAHARRQVEMDPWREGAHRQIMRLLALSGHRSEALAQYQRCQALLAEELGVEPAEATVALYEQIREGRLGAADHPEAPPLPRPVPPPFLDKKLVDPVRPLFVVRERELAQLEAHLNRALAGQGQVVFVTGEAGSGKTALIQEFAHRAQGTHASLVVAGGSCNAHTGLGDPYLPFREVLELLTGDVEARWAAGAMGGEEARRLWNMLPLTARALVEAGPDLINTFVPGEPLADRASGYDPPQPALLARLARLVESEAKGLMAPSSEQTDLFEQYAKVLQALAAQKPLMIVVDDLQWADRGSASLLFHLGRQLADSRILIAGAYRPVEVGLGRQGERHPLEPVANELARLYGDITIDVGQAEGQGFVEALLDSEPNRLGTSYREMLYQQTRGHPLFTTELLRSMKERGDLVQDVAGRWMEGPTLDWETLPARAEGVIGERIDRLDPPLRNLLRVACVEGEVFTAEVIAQVLDTEPRQAVQLLSRELDRRHRLVRAQALERLGPGRLSRYRFRHFLSQKYLYDSLDPVERSYLHEDVGNALEHLHGEGSSEIVQVAPQLARHFQAAGITQKAIHYLYLAGQRAAQLSAYQEALAYLSRGLELHMELPRPTPVQARRQHAQQELDLQLGLGVALSGIKGTPAHEVRDTFTRAQELCQELGKPSELSQVLGGLSIYYFVRSQHRTALELGEQALAQAHVAEDPLLEAIGHWVVAVILFGLGNYEASHGHLEKVLAFYQPDHHHLQFVHLRGCDAGVSALAYQACCLWCLGYPDQAEVRRQEALDLARDFDHPFTLADVLCYAGCMMDAMRRDAEGLQRDAEEIMQVARGSVVPWMESGARYYGEALLMQGRIQEGLAETHRSLRVGGSGGYHCFMSGTYGTLATAHAQAGQPEESLAIIGEALAFVAETDERHWEAEIYRVQAEVLLQQGDEAGAETSLAKAIEVARRQNARSWELRAAMGLARLWQRQGRGKDAQELLAPVFAWFTEGFDTPDLKEAAALLDELSHGTGQVSRSSPPSTGRLD